MQTNSNIYLALFVTTFCLLMVLCFVLVLGLNRGVLSIKNDRIDVEMKGSLSEKVQLASGSVPIEPNDDGMSVVELNMLIEGAVKFIKNGYTADFDTRINNGKSFRRIDANLVEIVDKLGIRVGLMRVEKDSISFTTSRNKDPLLWWKLNP